MLPIGISDAGSHLLEPESLVLGAAVGILLLGDPVSARVEALRRISPAVFGVLTSLEPAVATLAGFIVLGQALGELARCSDRAGDRRLGRRIAWSTDAPVSA